MAVFLPAFLQLAVSGALLLYMTCLLSSQQPMHSTVLLYAGAVSKTFTTQHMYKATWMLLTNKCFLLIFLTYIKVIYFRTSTLFHLFSSSWSVNNSLLSSSVMLSVSDLAMPSSFLSFPLKAATMSFPLWVKTLKSLLNGISHSATILWSKSAILTPVYGDGNLSTMQIYLNQVWRSVLLHQEKMLSYLVLTKY